MLRQLAARLPAGIFYHLRLAHYSVERRRGRFLAPEPEYDRLHEFVREGATVVDVGANVGHYTHRLATLAGGSGRVYAFEPMPDTFSLLAANISRKHRNVTLINCAASDHRGMVSMGVPSGDQTDHFTAKIGGGDFRVRSMPVDDLFLETCAFIKCDAEGHDLQVLMGAEQTIMRCRPIVMVESWMGRPPAQWLRDHEYDVTQAKGSANLVAWPKESHHV